jgi:hypothetical protein
MARTIEITVRVNDRASNPLQAIGGSLNNFGDRVGGMLQVAGGVLVANAITGMTRFFGSIGQGALESVGNVQNLEIAMEGLLTQSLMYQKVNEVHQEAVGLTEEEAQKLTKLGASLDVQNARMQEERERIRQMSEEWTDSGLNVQTAKARLAEMEVQAAETRAEIDKLTQKESEFATVTSESWQKMMDFSEAQGLAKDQAQELLSFVNKLSIVSPFETSQVELVTKLALGAKFTTDEVKKLVPAFLDYSSVVGITSENLAFAFDQFAQLRKIGKLTEIDLRQLRRLGIDVSQVLGVEMGMSVEEFNSQVEQSPELMDQLFEAFVKYASETTAGASQRMATTITGMMSTAHDIIDIGSRNLFRPIIEAISPMGSEMLSRLADLVTGPQIAELGQRLGEKLSAGIEMITQKGQELIAAYQAGGWQGVLEALGLSESAVSVIERAGAEIGNLAGAFREGGLQGLGEQIASDMQAAWPTIENQLIDWGEKFWDWINTTAIPAGQEKLTQVGDAINDAWPGIQAKLTEWGGKFWDWINTTAIPEAKTRLDSLADTITEWAHDPATGAKMESLGEVLGRGIVDGVAATIGGAYMALKTGDAFKSLPNALADATATLGTDIAMGIINGIGQKLNIDLGQGISSALEFIGVEGADELGRKLAEALVAGFKEALQTAMSMMNPVAFMRQQAGNVSESFTNLGNLLNLPSSQQMTGNESTSLWGAIGGGLSNLFGKEDSSAMANQMAGGLKEAFPDAISETGVGTSFVDGMAKDISDNEDSKRAMARAIAGGLPDYIQQESGASGQAFLDGLTAYVLGKLNMATGEIRP